MIREILADRLYLGNAMDARDKIYCRIPLHDGDGNPDAIIETAVRCVLTLIEKPIRTMVACSAGMSRSPAIAAAAMAVVTRSSPDDCLTGIASHGPHDVSPILWSRVKTVYNEIVGN